MFSVVQPTLKQLIVLSFFVRLENRVVRCVFVCKVISKIMVNECKRGEEIDFVFCFLVTIDDKFVVWGRVENNEDVCEWPTNPFGSFGAFSPNHQDLDLWAFHRA